MTEETHNRPRTGWSGGLSSVVLRLTSVNVLIVLAAVVTSPILARFLGPRGRGEVAAIFAIVSLAPWIADLGIASYLTHARARQSAPLRVLVGSTLPTAGAGAAVLIALAIPLAHLLGRDRPTVVFFVELGLYLVPLGVFTQALYGLVVAEERWRLTVASRLISTLGSAAVIVLLAIMSSLTVSSVAVTYLVFGVLAPLPFVVVLRGSFPWEFRPAIARTGSRFGLKNWLSSVAYTGNAQLDQVLMAGFVPSRQLGFYALAVTLSGVTTSLVAAVSTAILPRAARGDHDLVALASRLTTALVAIFGAVIALVAFAAIPLVFGASFRPVIPMLDVLLLASVFSAHAGVLGSALTARGFPGTGARAQLVGFAITIPGLAVALPTLGGLGAALVSLAAYFATFAVLLGTGSSQLCVPKARLLVADSADVAWVLRRISQSFRPASEPS